MLKKLLAVTIVAAIALPAIARQKADDDVKKYIQIIRKHILSDYQGMFREPDGALKYPFITPGSKQYENILWDWDSWLTNVALQQILIESGSEEAQQEAVKYEQGCVLNFLNFGAMDGYIPHAIEPASTKKRPKDIYNINMHKPVLAQHVAFLVKQGNGDAEWIKEQFYYLQAFVNKYRNFHRSKSTGLYYWENDRGLGVDNDPCTFDRPPKSSGSIFLNCLMYRELLSMVYIAEQLNLPGIAEEYEKEVQKLLTSIQENCWDERDGFFYSVDLNLVPVSTKPLDELGYVPHAGYPRDWDCLIQRIGVWSGFLGMWAEIATPEQAKRMVEEHLKNPKTFGAAYGVRSLSKMEKMYSVRASGNPSCWLGPVWGISNYMVFRGLVKYGFTKEAKELAEKTIILFGKDYEENGALHEYYDPENGEPILNKGFQNWNYLVLNMIAWLEGKPFVMEF